MALSAGPSRRRALPVGARGPVLAGVLDAAGTGGASDPAAAAVAARGLRAAGAAAIAIRPAPDGAAPAQQGTLGVLEAVRAAVDVPVAVDTPSPAVALRALAAGADAIRDASGLGPAALLRGAAETGASLILAAAAPSAPRPDAVGEVGAELASLRDRALAAGVPEARLLLDPGLDGGAATGQDLELVAGLPLLRARLGLPLCVAAGPAGRGGAALVALAAAYGAELLWVRDLQPLADVARLAAAVGPPLPAALDRISLRGLRVAGRHGALPAERERPQPFEVDLELEVGLQRAIASDDLAATVNYAEVAELAAAVLRGPSRRLIERLAGEIAAAVLERFPAVAGGAVTVHKPEAPVGLPFADVCVTHRFRRGARTEVGRA